tara:strand:- start:1599 stop:1748 length:150 start_codon:yes stop_codon:yes gene_type:complete
MNYIIYQKLPSGRWKYVLRHSSEVEANKDARMFQRRGIEAKVIMQKTNI